MVPARQNNINIGRSWSRETNMNHFQKRDGTADGAGQRFEVKILAFLFLRGLNMCRNFRMASNMNHCGAFDDVIFQHKRDNMWETSFLQLKHKKKSVQSMEIFAESRSAFNLMKYLQSYHIIKQQFSAANKNHPVFGGNFEHCTFLLYTNSVFSTKRELHHGCFLKDDIHNSGGSNGFVFSLSENNEEDEFVMSLLNEYAYCKQSLDSIHCRNGESIIIQPAIIQEISELLNSIKSTDLISLLENLKNRPLKQNLEKILEELDYVSSRSTFLNKVKVLDGQADVNALDDVIRRQIHETCRTNSDETNRIHKELIQHIEAWWRSGTEFITEEAEFWRNMMQSRIDRVARLSSLKLQQLNSINVRFRVSEITPMDGSVVNVVSDSGCTLLSCAKLRQMLDALDKPKYLIVDMSVIKHQMQEMLSLWPTRWCDTLIVDCGKSDEGSSLLLELGHKYKLVLVTSSVIPGAKCVHFDTCGYMQMDEATQVVLLEKSIMFQGYEVLLKNVTENNVDLLNKVNAEMVLNLLEGVHCVEVGKPLQKPSYYYIKRRIKSCLDVKGPFPIPTSIWCLEDRIILISADPGVGKTTFIEQISLQSKETYPTFWVVRVKLNEHSAALNELSESDYSLEQALEFLWEVAGKKHNSEFERKLFWHAFHTSGKCAVLFDAFDEINPTFTTKTLNLIEAVSKSKIGKLCVAFRPVVQEILESLLDVSSFTLNPLSETEQKDLLQAYWIHCANQSNVRKLMMELSEEEIKNIRDIGMSSFNGGDTLEKLRYFCQRILSSTSSKLSNDFWSVPLHITLLAVVFESYLVVSMNDDGMYIVDEFDIIDLYREFVEKKLNIYCNEKKEEETKTSAIVDDNEVLRELFMENHKISGVVALLPANLLDELHNKELLSKTETFLKRMEEGKEKRGVVVQVIEGKPLFVHRTLAEYFAAMWFAENYHENRHVLEVVYFSDTNKVFREMFDRILSENCPLIQHILNRNVEAMLSIVSTDIKKVDSGGRTALHVSALYENFSFICVSPFPSCTLMDILLYHDPSLTAVDQVFEFTPIQYADRVCNNLVMGELFRSLNFDSDNIHLATSCQHVTPSCDCITGWKDLDSMLTNAVQYGNFDLVLKLLKSGANINSRNEYEETPLQVAVENNHFEMIRMLLEEGGADFTICNHRGESVIDIAREQVMNMKRNKLPFIQKCLMYYSENDNVLLPYRNWYLFQSYYSPQFAKLKFNSNACVYQSMHRHLFVENLEHKIRILILKYLENFTASKLRATDAVIV
ncbi:uncharacterized protein [Periplaneta americana]|uniref:uncharacterized protein n=1 Tax=Periplaneta americana TaxID=6978 RepID=UPI0037E893E5